jgi:hypothetical protein
MQALGVRTTPSAYENDRLERGIAELLTLPVGKPRHLPVAWYKSFLCQTASWQTARAPDGGRGEFYLPELFPRVGFIVTILEMYSRAVVRFCNKPGTVARKEQESCQMEPVKTAAVAGHGVLRAIRTALSGLLGRHSEEEQGLQRLEDRPIVVR